jgi:starvation-inducible DNA-binding protein
MTQATEYRIATALQQQLANAIVLYLNYKQYHWQTYGPLFRDLHLLFDEHAKDVLGTIDPLGERLRILGATPVASPREVGSTATINQAGEKRTLHDMLQEAFANHEHVIQELRQAIKVADTEGDPGTSNLFGDIIQMHEKQAWFLREALQKGDGLVT